MVETVLCVELCIDPLGVIPAARRLIRDNFGLLVDHLLNRSCLLVSLSALRGRPIIIVILSDIDFGL